MSCRWIILGSKIFFREGWGDEVVVTVNKYPSLTCQILTHLYKDREKQTKKEALNKTRKTTTKSGKMASANCICKRTCLKTGYLDATLERSKRRKALSRTSTCS